MSTLHANPERYSVYAVRRELDYLLNLDATYGPIPARTVIIGRLAARIHKGSK